MTKTLQHVYGIVGIFDVLGARNFDDSELEAFVASQQELIKFVERTDDGNIQSMTSGPLETFTFNDTIIIALRAEKQDIPRAIGSFCQCVRQFITRSLMKRLFFRGAFSIGNYSVNVAQNLIMGKAVTDAASWHEQIEFVGAIATPKASMMIHHAIQPREQDYEFLLFETDIKSKLGSKKLFAVNWPKTFYVPSLRPRDCEKGHERACLLGLLAANEVPIGTEHKYANTRKFFEEAPLQGIDKSS
jgi:hypothetical protein